MTTVGARIRQARELVGWSQAQLAKALGVDRSQVSRWEGDEQVPRGANRLRIGQALGVSYEWLRTGEGGVDIGGMVQNQAAFQADPIDEAAIRAARNINDLFGLRLGDVGLFSLGFMVARLLESQRVETFQDVSKPVLAAFMQDVLARCEAGKLG